MAQKKYTYYICHGIVKTKINPETTKKSVWEFQSVDYDAASRYAKRHAVSNYQTDYKTVTLFDERGYPMGWCFRTMGEIVYVSKSALQSIGLIPKSRK